MQAPAIATAADVVKLTEEELLRLVGETHCVPARNALVERHFWDVCDLLARHGRKFHLGDEDREDARQEVLCALLKGLERFAAASNGAGGGLTMRVFLGAFTQRRFANCVRTFRRQESHVDRSTPVQELLERASPQRIGCGRDDPSELAAKRELRARLDAALPKLDASMRRLWEELASGHSLRACAAALGMSYYQVRRLCKRMIDMLRDQLMDGTDDARGVSETERTRP
jgi:RNA polymerase sigma factor (sigma-70 family)